jgi:hypothetical protein
VFRILVSVVSQHFQFLGQRSFCASDACHKTFQPELCALIAAPRRGKNKGILPVKRSPLN